MAAFHTKLTQRRDGYTVLLVLLILFLFLQSSDHWNGLLGTLVVVGRGLIGFTTLFVVFDLRRDRLIGGLALGATFVLLAASQLAHSNVRLALEICYHLIMVVFLTTTLVTILRRILRARSEGSADVLGAICGYLLAGDALSAINSTAYLLWPGAYSVSQSVAPLLTHAQGRTAVFAYYSFSQMLTLGYADVNPIRAPATTLSLFGALFGLFYTAIVVAQFVSLEQGPSKNTPGKP